MIEPVLRLPVQCRCGAFTILDPTDQIVDDCPDCEVIHVAVAATGTCRRCGDTLTHVWQVNVSAEQPVHE